MSNIWEKIPIIGSFFGSGKKEHHHYHTTIEYRQDPAQIELIKKLQEELKNLNEVVKTPEGFRSEKKRIQKLFIEHVSKKKFDSPLSPQERLKKHVCLIGPTSVGKSSLLNGIFGLEQPTGLGRTTTEARVVMEDDNFVYWDVPGINELFESYSPRNLGLFQSMTKIYVLFSAEINDVQFIAHLFTEMGLNVEYVRTKCDNWQEGQKPIAEQLEIDLQEARMIDPRVQRILASGRGMNHDISLVMRSP